MAAMARDVRTTIPGRSARCLSTALWVGAVLTAAGCQVREPAATLPLGAPALHQAVAAGDRARASELIQTGGSTGLEAAGPFGWTPLHVAAIFNRPALVRLLLAARAAPDALDSVGMTPLHWAARRGNPEAVRLLLEAGADLMARNKFDMTPLHEAHTQPVARLLLEAGADLMARDLDGFTPLHTAPNKKVAELLIDRGADLNARSRDGRTPLEMPPMATPRTAPP